MDTGIYVCIILNNIANAGDLRLLDLLDTNYGSCCLYFLQLMENCVRSSGRHVFALRVQVASLGCV